MFDNKEIAAEMLRNPLKIEMDALSEIESRLGGNKIIADPNSPFCHLLEFGSSLAAGAINILDNKLPTIYPQRATSMKDLYQHMSDFDYLKMYSTPSQTTLRMTLPKPYLSEYALTFNSNFKKVTIPKDSVFMIGRFPFGMYYPIDILINNYTHTFTVTYDTTVSSPLNTLTKNILSKYDTTYKGVDYLIFDFPVYQFSRSVLEESLSDTIGFSKTFIYNNKFYAVRLFTYTDGVYTELGQTQSENVYDVSRPTAVIRIYPDEQKFKITIPQVYFNSGMMGSRLYIEVYTTLGAMDIDTTAFTSDKISVNFAQKSKDTTEFSRILKNLPFDTIIQLNSSKITGGSDAISVSTLRDRVVNDTLYQKAPITEEELKVYLNDNSFYVKKSLDNITDRIYYAYRVLEDGNGSIIPSITLPLRISTSYTADRATFLLQSDDSITVLPTTLFRYNTETSDVVPITTEEMTTIAKYNKQELANELNNNQYYKTPFHMRLSLGSKPSAISFNLFTPKIDKIIFESENYNISLKMIASDASIVHLSEGTGGYDVYVSVSKSDDFSSIAEEDILVYAAVKTTSEYWIGTTCTYVEDINSRTVYKFHIGTNYRLTENSEIGITELQNESIILNEHTIPLETDFYLVFMVKRTSVTTEYEDAPQKVTVGVPSTYLNTHVALARQYLTIHLGHILDDVIKNDMEISSTPLSYATWDHDVPETYSEDVYETDENGLIKFTISEDGTLTTNLLHAAGDVKFTEAGDPIYKHRYGDVRIGADGNPIVAAARDRIFFVSTMLIAAKVFASERNAELTFVSNIYENLEGYFDVIRNLQSQLLERTYVYFRCVRSTGTAKFNFGNGIITNENIEMSFRIQCYVPSYVYKDESIQSQITETICDTVEEAIKTKEISMPELFEDVRTKMSDYIDHFTLLGTNGNISNQTFVIVDDDAQPSIERKLVLTEDNILSLTKQIDIEFIALNDNTASTDTYSV